MELVVGALVVLALIAIAARFLFRDASGGVRLPRIIDDSIGMWVVRQLLRRPTDPAVDPLARFRRPSTVLARRATPTPHPARRRAAPAGSRAATVPAVLREPATRLTEEPIPPAWTTIDRPATGARPFGESILVQAPATGRSRIRAVLRYGVLVTAVAIGGLAAGALAGLASGPSPSAATGSPGGSAVRSGPPQRSSADPSAR